MCIHVYTCVCIYIYIYICTIGRVKQNNINYNKLVHTISNSSACIIIKRASSVIYQALLQATPMRSN